MDRVEHREKEKFSEKGMEKAEKEALVKPGIVGLKEACENQRE